MKIALYLTLAAAIFAGAFFFQGQAYADSAVLPGINAKDDYPQGCVNCHTGAGGGQPLVNVLVKAIKNHADISMITKSVPDGCVICHKKGGPSAPITQVTHKQHYENPGQSKFIANFGGACLSCHSLDVKSGIMSIKKGKKNW